MKLSELKRHLNLMNGVSFLLPDGSQVPAHFHVTEVGQINKHFIDCGGTIRREEVVSLQLWSSYDVDHRLKAGKLKSIIELSEDKLGLGDHEIEVEYQGDTIGKYGLEFNGEQFVLSSKQTDCLAKENCGVPEQKTVKQLATLGAEESSGGSCCQPGSGCC